MYFLGDDKKKEGKRKGHSTFLVEEKKNGLEHKSQKTHKLSAGMVRCHLDADAGEPK